MDKEFDIQGKVTGLPPDMDEEMFWRTIIQFFEEHGWYFGGGLEIAGISGCASEVPEEMAPEEFERLFRAFLAENSWGFEGRVTVYGEEA